MFGMVSAFALKVNTCSKINSSYFKRCRLPPPHSAAPHMQRQAALKQGAKLLLKLRICAQLPVNNIFVLYRKGRQARRCRA